MFSKNNFFGNIINQVPGMEKLNVETFLKNSDELKQMESIYLNNPSNNLMKNMLENLKKATSYADILKATELVNFEDANPSDPMLNNAAGRLFLKAALSVTKYIDNEAKFGSYARALRLNAINSMNDCGYSRTVAHP